MKRRLVLAVIALAGAVAGGAGALALQDDPAPFVPARPAPVVTLPAPADDGVLLVWTPEQLPPALTTGLPTGVDRSTMVRAGDLDLVASRWAEGAVVDQAPPGFAYPLDTIGIDPATFAAFVPASARVAVESLAPGRALLGATSARLRRLAPGGVVELSGGRRLVVSGVIADELVGAAELVLHVTEAAAVGLPPRYALLQSSRPRPDVEAAVHALVPAGVPARVRALGETPFLRHGDAVIPQALVKETFGEFAYRRVAGRDIEQDPAWQRDHLVALDLPGLGATRCHRGVAAALEGALGELDDRNLLGLVERGGFAGCWAPRTIEPGAPLSRHAWGIALDVNVMKNPTGVASVQDPRLVEIMRKWGFASGAQWLVPDPSHFEYLRPPAP